MHRGAGRHYAWLFLEVSYLEGLPELIQLPLAFHHYREDVDYSKREEAICRVNADEGDLVMIDALVDDDFRITLANGFQDVGDLKDVSFRVNDSMLMVSTQELKPVHSGTEYLLLQSKDFNIKFYRRIHVSDTPDLEVKRMLNRQGYANAPTMVGSLHFSPKKGMDATLGIFENRISSEGTAWDYMRNNLNRFGEDVLARLQQSTLESPAAKPEEISITDEVVYRNMPKTIQEILGATFITKMAELGRTIAAYHTIMNDVSGQKTFEREALSLHYQRSVYAGLKADVRGTIDLLKKSIPVLDDDASGFAEALIEQEAEIHTKLKRVFAHKIESDKIRIHGDFTLEQVAMSDDKFIIQSFDGDPDRTFSQRTLRRSPAKDLANLMRSVSYASGLIFEDLSSGVREETADHLEDWLRTASRYLSAEFLTAYRKATSGTRLLPEDDADLEVLLDTFRIEKALQELRYDLNYRTAQVKIPLRGLLELLED
jgi:maltose alpha-D-glucosyltransferase/alpha-amylase